MLKGKYTNFMWNFPPYPINFKYINSTVWYMISFVGSTLEIIAKKITQTFTVSFNILFSQKFSFLLF